MKIEMGKQYKTRDGREVRIYATDCGTGVQQVHGAVKRENGGWYPASWSISGVFRNGSNPNPIDLVEVKPRIVREAWLNVYDHDRGDVLWSTKQQADDARTEGCLACVRVPIDCEEGEGLNG